MHPGYIKGDLGCIQGTFRVHPGCIQGKCIVNSGIFRVNSGWFEGPLRAWLQVSFKVHSGWIQGAIAEAPAQWRSQGKRGERTLPLKMVKYCKINLFGVKNLKILKVGLLFVSVNSDPKIIEPPTLDLPIFEPPTIYPPTADN